MKKYLFYILFLLLCLEGYGDPVDPSIKKVIKNQSGKLIEAVVIGDEMGEYYYDQEENQFYAYNYDKNSFEVINIDDISRKNAEKRMIRRNSPNINPLIYPFGIAGYSGNKTGLVLLVEFCDIQFDTEHSPDYYNKIINERNLIDSKFTAGSVRDYFMEQSNGQFDLKFDIVGPIRMPKEYSYYGEDVMDGLTRLKLDKNIGEMIIQACMDLDSKIDFSKYDWNGDGIVEQIGVIYSGLAQSSTHVYDDIWPQKSNLDYYDLSLSLDDVTIRNFFISSEYRTQNFVSGIGTFCHEFSHCMGLPDTYNAENVHIGTQQWNLMGDGVHNKSGFVPAGFSAFEKMYCGWMQPIELINDDNIFGMKPLSIGGESYMITNKAYPQEFFILENRQKIGFDAGLPGEGLLIYHIDYNPYDFSQNRVNTSNVRRCNIIVADGSEEKNRQECCYPTMNNNSFTNTSAPKAELNHKNIDGKFLLSKPIRNIQQCSDKTISFTYANDVGDQNYEAGLTHVELDEAGSLNTLIPQEDMFGILSLKASGKMNGTDILFLRKMSGRDETNAPTSGILKNIDMENVSFEKGGDIYMYNNGHKSSVTDENIFPENGMYYTGIERVILPKSISTIGAHAFEYCKSLKEVIIGNNIKNIEQEAFYSCESLEELTLPYSIEFINIYALGNCQNLKSITCFAITPPIAYDYSFSEESYRNSILSVPYGRKAAYESAKGWKNFKNIIEMEPTDLPANLPDNQNLFEVYTLTGILIRKNSSTLFGLPRGIYLVNGKKIMVR